MKIPVPVLLIVVAVAAAALVIPKIDLALSVDVSVPDEIPRVATQLGLLNADGAGTPVTPIPDNGPASSECFSCRGLGWVGDGRHYTLCIPCEGTGREDKSGPVKPRPSTSQPAMQPVVQPVKQSAACDCADCQCDPCACGSASAEATQANSQVKPGRIYMLTAVWCPACKHQLPVMAALHKEGHDVMAVDIEKYPALARKLGYDPDDPQNDYSDYLPQTIRLNRDRTKTRMIGFESEAILRETFGLPVKSVRSLPVSLDSGPTATQMCTSGSCGPAATTPRRIFRRTIPSN